ncbi:MAG: hypothetical protein ACFFAO_15680, partial [Candidatus Hermodarchaeota archaeon]
LNEVYNTEAIINRSPVAVLMKRCGVEKYSRSASLGLQLHLIDLAINLIKQAIQSGKAIKYMPNIKYLNKVKDILKRKDFKAFLPIISSDDLLEFELDEVKPLFTDNECNLMKMMMLTVQNYEKDISDILHVKDLIDLFTYDLEKWRSEIIESIDDIISDPKIKDIKCLLIAGLFRWYDPSNFFKKVHPSIFTLFLRYLHNVYINPEIDWKPIKGVPFYYEGLGKFLTDTHRKEVIKLIEELDIDFPILIVILGWFEFFSPEQLVEIERILISKYPGIVESQDKWERKLLLSLKTKEEREKTQQEHVNKVIEDCAEALLKEYDINPALVLTNFHLFSMDFFSNTPQVPMDEIHEWHYLRDGLTHAAVIFNERTKEVRLVEPDKYWTEDVWKEFKNKI